MSIVRRQHSRRDDTAARLVGMDRECVSAIDAALLLAEDGDVGGRIAAGLRTQLRIVAHIVPAFGTTDGEHQDISAALACFKEGEYFGGTTKSCEPSTLPCESICAPRQRVDEHSCFYTRRERVQWTGAANERQQRRVLRSTHPATRVPRIRRPCRRVRQAAEAARALFDERTAGASYDHTSLIRQYAERFRHIFKRYFQRR